MFTARYGLVPYIQQITFRLLKVKTQSVIKNARCLVIWWRKCNWGVGTAEGEGYHGLILSTGCSSFDLVISQKNSEHSVSRPTFQQASSDNSVDIVAKLRAVQPRNRGSIFPARFKFIISSFLKPYLLWGPNFYGRKLDTRQFPRLKQPEREANHSTPPTF